MVNKLIDWALSNRFIILMMTAALAVVGFHSYSNINVEAYPDPAPALVEIVAQWPGASAEEMERQVTIPLEVTMAGMPNLKATYSKSLFGLSHLRCVFNYGYPYKDARQEVLNRLANLTQPLPAGVSPVISPASPIGEIYRYTLKTPKDALGREIYTLNDIKALEDWFIERHFRRVPRIIDISSFGGTVKRYEIQPDPEQLKRYGITLNQVQNALANSNANVGGDFLTQGRTAQVVRCLGTIGQGKDPMEKAFGMRTPEEAAAYLREEEQVRLREIRKIVITTFNNQPITIDDVVVGGRLDPPDGLSTQGVVVTFQTRLGMISQDKAMDMYQITDKTLAELHKNHVPDAVVKKLAMFQGKNFDSKELFLKRLSQDQFKITNDSLAAMRTDGVPDDVLAKLGPMTDKLYESRELFSYELDKFLIPDEMDTFENKVLKHALTRILDKDEFRRYADLAVEHSEGVKYILTDKTLGALKSKDVPESALKKLSALKDQEFKTREAILDALAQIPEVQERFKITDKTLATLRAEKVPEAILTKLVPLKDKGFKTADLFDAALAQTIGRDVVEASQITDKSLASLRMKGLPAPALAKVAPLKDKSFANPRQLNSALAEIFNKDELSRYQEAIFASLVSLQDLIPNNADVEYLQDTVMDQARIFWRHQDEKIQGVVLMRKGEESLPSIEGVKKKVAELNQPGHLLPGVELEAYYDREDLVHLTTHTVRENLLVGIGLVVLILMVFLSNIKTAVIVALNIPIALLIAFAALYLRGESANLLSIGAVDFGIIVDSAVIMTENIFRNLASGEHAELPLKERILRATREIDRALLFSTLIMVVAFIPLFSMKGAEGQLFGPMSQTYAFALGGALFMALTLTPVLCLMLLKNVTKVPENFLVRYMKNRYLWQLRACLNHRRITVAVIFAILGVTLFWALPRVGREFMPELEEGSLWIRGIYPVNSSLDTIKDSVQEARKIMSSDRYPEIAAVVAQIGRPDDGTDPGLFNNVEVFVPLKPEREWPVVDRPNGQRATRTHREIVEDMNAELNRKLPGVEWQFSQYIRDNVMEAISGVKGDNCVKIFGPDLDKLEELAEKTKAEMSKIKGLHDLGVYRIMGQSNLEFVVDKDKCKRYGVQVADVNNVINAWVHGNAATQMVEGEKLFDITVRGPFDRRWDRERILEIPVDITNNTVTPGFQAGANQNPVNGPNSPPSATGNSNPPPTVGGGVNLPYYPGNMPSRLYLKNFVSPISREDWRPDPETLAIDAGTLSAKRTQKTHALKLSAGKTYVFSAYSGTFEPDVKVLDARGTVVWSRNNKKGSKQDDVDLEHSYTPNLNGPYRLVVSAPSLPADGQIKEHTYTLTVRTLGGDFSRPAGSIITREDGKRFIAVKFSVRGDRDLASVVDEVREKTASIFKPPYFMAMGGEFQQMEDGEKRLLFYIPASLVLIFLLLYIAFQSLMDAVVVLSNVLALAVGGIWSLYLTGTNFSISAAVGFVSLFGVAIMDGLLMIAYFNDLRRKGLPVDEAIMKGAALRVRPVTMTALTAILGLLPAAFSTAIGSQTQRPLAIVVVGGMLTCLFLTRYLMPIFYSFYGHREPPASSSSMSH